MWHALPAFVGASHVTSQMWCKAVASSEIVEYVITFVELKKSTKR